MKVDTICYRCGLKNIINSIFFGSRSIPVRFFPVKLPMKRMRFQILPYEGIIVNSSLCCCVSCGLIWTYLNAFELKKFVLDKGTAQFLKSFEDGNLKYFEENSENCLKCFSIKTIKGKIGILGTQYLISR